MVHSYSSTDTVIDWKKFRFILSDRSDFHEIDNLFITSHAFVRRGMLTSFSKDAIFLPRYVNWSTSFRDLSLQLENGPSRTMFYLCSSKDRCFRLSASGYTVGIWLRQMYLWEPLDRLFYPYLSEFLRDIICFQSFLIWNNIFSLNLLKLVLRNLSRL